ncbi:MAG: class I SAM-dependent rRNA methyltransferase [Nitritalea sp.]
MSNYPLLRLKKGKEISISRKHHWIFSGAILSDVEQLNSGSLVTVADAAGKALATGHFQFGSIMVRLLSFTPREINLDFWVEKLSEAWQLRRELGLVRAAATNLFRWVHGEGDGLPGLIIDVFDQVAVIQTHQVGMHAHVAEIAEAIRRVAGDSIHAIYDKSKETLPADYACTNSWLWGDKQHLTAVEHGIRYAIDVEKGQKTGFFIDQRENRALLGSLSAGKCVLNTFSYSGGFSLAALKGGAAKVCSVDISAQAIQLVQENIALNPELSGAHEALTADVIPYLKDIQAEDFDIIVLDPPAFAKNIKARHRAVQAYKRLNATALRKIKPGGLLFTFSCSQVVDKALFTHTITAAALEAGRAVRILKHLEQPGDHPVNIFHQETSYLKGLLLYVS